MDKHEVRRAQARRFWEFCKPKTLADLLGILTALLGALGFLYWLLADAVVIRALAPLFALMFFAYLLWAIALLRKFLHPAPTPATLGGETHVELSVVRRDLAQARQELAAAQKSNREPAPSPRIEEKAAPTSRPQQGYPNKAGALAALIELHDLAFKAGVPAAQKISNHFTDGLSRVVNHQIPSAHMPKWPRIMGGVAIPQEPFNPTAATTSVVKQHLQTALTHTKEHRALLVDLNERIDALQAAQKATVQQPMQRWINSIKVPQSLIDAADAWLRGQTTSCSASLWTKRHSRC